MDIGKDLQKAYDEGYEQGAKDLAERLKRYYDNLKGRTPCSLVAFHIDEILKEMFERENINLLQGE